MADDNRKSKDFFIFGHLERLQRLSRQSSSLENCILRRSRPNNFARCFRSRANILTSGSGLPFHRSCWALVGPVARFPH